MKRNFVTLLNKDKSKIDRSFTTDLNYIEGDKIIHPDKHVGDYILDKEEYITCDANHFFMEESAETLLNSLNKLKNKEDFIIEISNFRDNKAYFLVAENKTHFQVVYKSDFSDAYLDIFRKDEQPFVKKVA